MISQNAFPPPIIAVGVLDPKLISVKIKMDLDFKTFNKNSFHTEFCKLLCIDPSAFKIIEVKEGSVVVFGQIQGEENMRRIHNPPREVAQQFRICEILLGTFDLDIGPAVMNPNWNREYHNGPQGTYWEGALRDPNSRGPYFCPVGWKRYSIRVGTAEEFDRKCNGWHVAYHGSKNIHASSILQTGFKPGKGCFLGENEAGVYFSPSIEYSAHPRYAKPWRTPDGKYVQMIFQCRVNRTAIWRKAPETLLKDSEKATVIDRNFPNNQLEWIVKADNPNVFISNLHNQVVCYGIMLRVSDNPNVLPSSSWWPKVHDPLLNDY